MYSCIKVHVITNFIIMIDFWSCHRDWLNEAKAHTKPIKLFWSPRRPPAFCVEFAFSSSGHNNFLPQSKHTHTHTRSTGDSKLAVSVNVSVDGCLMGALRSPNKSEFFCVTPPQLPLGKLKQNNVPPSYQSKMAALNVNSSKTVNF